MIWSDFGGEEYREVVKLESIQECMDAVNFNFKEYKANESEYQINIHFKGEEKIHFLQTIIKYNFNYKEKKYDNI